MKLSESLRSLAKKVQPEVREVFKPAVAAAKTALALAILQKIAVIAEKYVNADTPEPPKAAGADTPEPPKAAGADTPAPQD